MKTANSLLRHYLSSFRKPLLVTLLVAFLSSIATILVPLSIGKFSALVFGLSGGKSGLFDFLPSEFVDTVPHFLIFFFILLMVKFILGFGQRYLISSAGERLVNQIRIDLFEHQIGIDMSVYDEKGIGKYLLRYSGDLKSIQNYITRGIIGFVVDLGLLAIALIFLGLINFQIALIIILVLPVISVPILLLNRKLNRVSEIRRNKRSNLLSFINQRLIGILTVKAFNRHKPELQKFNKRSQVLLHQGLRYHELASLIYVLIPFMLYSMLGVIMFTINKWQSSGFTIDKGATLAAFFLLLSMLPVFRRLLKVPVVWDLGRISLDKLARIWTLPNNYAQKKDDLILVQPRVSLQGLNFNFGDKPIFKGLNHRWEGRGIHLVRGNVGSGKTTLIKLLLGLYYPQEGQVLIDGQSSAEVNERSLRKSVAVVSPDYPLLGRTVFESISYSRKASKRKYSQELLDKLQSFLPLNERLQLTHRIGEGGSQLSKGQEMLLLMVRALLTKKEILLLDEPFRHMDGQMRKHFYIILQELGSSKMILLFTKRTTIRQLTPVSSCSLDTGVSRRMLLKKAG